MKPRSTKCDCEPNKANFRIHDSSCFKSKICISLGMFWKKDQKLFICPKDEQIFEDSTNFLEHLRICQNSVELEESAEPKESAKPEEYHQNLSLPLALMDEVELKSLKMAYDKNYKKIICLECLKVAGQNIIYHFKQNHHIVITDEEQERIKKSFMIVPEENYDLKVPIAHIPIRRGFCCPECFFSQLSDRFVFKHMKKAQHYGRPKACLVQRPRPGSSSPTIYVGII